MNQHPDKDRPRITGAWKALLWLGVLALALYPFPFWL